MAVASEELIPHYRAERRGVPADFMMSGKDEGGYCYYRQPNGWLTMGLIGKRNAMEHIYQDRGWTSLRREYGAFDFPHVYYTDMPFEVLFQRGGAAEMPLDQIQALGYDRNPPLLPRCNLALGTEHQQVTKSSEHIRRCWTNPQPVVFPQLAGLTPTVVSSCEFCERADFTSKKGREQHMRVMHLDEIKEIAAAREIGQSVRDAVIAGVQGGGGAVAAGAGAAVAGMAARPFGCGYCGETFAAMRGRNPETSLEAHVRLHDEESGSDEETTEDA